MSTLELMFSWFVSDLWVNVVFMFPQPLRFVFDPRVNVAVFKYFLDPRVNVVFVFSTPEFICSWPLSRCRCLYFLPPSWYLVIILDPRVDVVFTFDLRGNVIIFTFSNPRVDVVFVFSTPKLTCVLLYSWPPSRYCIYFLNPRVDMLFPRESFISSAWISIEDSLVNLRSISQ